MSIKVIGAGFGRTGTLSLKFALESLGFDKCYHMMEVMQNPEHVDCERPDPNLSLRSHIVEMGATVRSGSCGATCMATSSLDPAAIV